MSRHRHLALWLCAASSILLAVATEPAAAKPTAKLTIKVSGAAVEGSTVVVEGKAPPTKKLRVVLERADGKKWATLASASPSKGRFKASFKAPPASTLSVRARGVVGKKTVAISKTLEIKVAKQTPQSAPVVPPRSSGAGDPPAAPVPPGGGSSTPVPGDNPAPTPTAPSPTPTPAPLSTPAPSPAPTPAPSPTPTPQPGQFEAPGVTYSVPPKTVEFSGRGAQTSVVDDESFRTTFDAGTTVPPVGGHVALGPSTGAPDGLLGKVTAVSADAQGRPSVTVAPAPLDQIFTDLQYESEGELTPRVVDESGQPVQPAPLRGADLVLKNTARTGASNPFECKKTGLGSDEPLQSTAMPLSVEFQNMKHIARLDLGNKLLNRDPFLYLQLSGEAVIKLGFQARYGMTCSLTNAYKRSNRIVFPLKSIGAVPVAVYLEPNFSFSISAGGSIETSIRRYFAITLDKSGGRPLDLRLAGSTGEPKISGAVDFSASAFAGGELSMLVGTANKRGTSGVGLAGATGPKLTLSTSSSRPGCLTLSAAWMAKLQARFALFSSQWDVELAEVKTDDRVFFDKCVDRKQDLKSPVKPADGGVSIAFTPPPVVEGLTPRYVICEWRRQSEPDQVQYCGSTNALGSPVFFPGYYATAGIEYRVFYQYDGDLKSRPTEWIRFADELAAPSATTLRPVNGGVSFAYIPPPAVDGLTPRYAICEWRRQSEPDQVQYCGSTNALGSPVFFPGYYATAGIEYRVLYQYDGDLKSRPTEWLTSESELAAPSATTLRPVNGGVSFAYSAPPAVEGLTPRYVICEWRRDNEPDQVQYCGSTNALESPVFFPGYYATPGIEYRVLYQYDGDLKSRPTGWLTSLALP